VKDRVIVNDKLNGNARPSGGPQIHCNQDSGHFAEIYLDCLGIVPNVVPLQRKILTSLGVSA
jgi:hypothetical protein